MTVRKLESSTKNRNSNQTSMPPKKQALLPKITSSGRTIKQRIELETYSSLDEDSYSDSDSDSSIPPLTPSTSRKTSGRKSGNRKRTASASSGTPLVANSKEYQEKRARNNDAVRRSRQRRKEKQVEAQRWLESSNNQKNKLAEIDGQLDAEMDMLKMILARGLSDPTVNLSKFLKPDSISKLVLESSCMRGD